MEAQSGEHDGRSSRPERVWLRPLSRTQTIVVATTLGTIAVITGALYYHYSRVIDLLLRDGAFPESANIYAAPLVLNLGDTVTPADLDSELRLCGYRESVSRAAGTFHADGKVIDIVPPRGSAQLPVRVVLGDKQQIVHIGSGAREARSWTAGYPLLANLSNISTGIEKRRPVRFGDIPPTLVQAVISVEDKHFFQHRGIDLPRLILAAWVDFRDQRKEQGASTLTMQLVRGLWLDPQKHWRRKLAEVMMTIHLERQWSKEKIFETYANQIYLGREGAYDIRGFAEASQIYFGKDLRFLSASDTALLAGMVQRPSYFNPYRHPDRARDRRDVVLSLMHGNGYLTDAQYTSALQAPLNLVGASQPADEFAAQWLLDLVASERQEQEPDQAAGSLFTTLDLNLQRAAIEAMRSGMEQVDKLVRRRGKSDIRPQAALIALDPHTGEIKAMLGGRDYARSQFNRVLSRRPPGSVFKPFVYAAALNTGVVGGNKVFTPASLVNDDATTFWFDGKAYEPGNFHHESFGTITLKEALAHSDNVAAVRVAQQVGFGSVVSMAQRAGLNSDIRATPSVALGSYAVTPLEMAGAYTAFANGGTWVKPRWSAGSKQIESRQTMDPRVAYLMVSMLQEVMRSGTAAGVRSRGFLLPAAGKTGTSHDGWFAGFTSQLLCVVWVGFDDYRELDLEGAKSALPIWTEFMKKASQLGPYRNASPFSSPGGVVTVNICTESGKLAGEFCPARAEVFIAGTEPHDSCDSHDMLPLEEVATESAP